MACVDIVINSLMPQLKAKEPGYKVLSMVATPDCIFYMYLSGKYTIYILSYKVTIQVVRQLFMNSPNYTIVNTIMLITLPYFL